MRVVVWGINYSPELTGIGPCNTVLCEYLAGKGHEVEMVTAFAYYPAWLKSAEDSGKLFRTDVINGVRVRRCWHYVPAVVTTKKRIWHELSFVIFSSFRFLFLKKPDVFVVVSPPLLLGLAAWLVGLVKGSRFVFHVQDLQPDAAVGLGMLKIGAMTRLLYWLEDFAYRKAAKVSGISHGMLRAFGKKNVGHGKLVYFPNGIELQRQPFKSVISKEEGAIELANNPIMPGGISFKRSEAIALEEIPRKGGFRARYEFAETDFLAVYSGNLGAKQGLTTLVAAASLLHDPRVKIIVCGDGVQRDELIAQARGKQIFFLPLLEQTEYRQMLEDSDICLITQARGTGGVFFPSKLLAALAQSKPVLSVADEESELACAIKEAACGINVLPGSPVELAAKLDEIASKADVLIEMGQRGRAYVAQFELTQVLEKFEESLKVLGH